jgi:hypothetical protein
VISKTFRLVSTLAISCRFFLLNGGKIQPGFFSV